MMNNSNSDIPESDSSDHSDSGAVKESNDFGSVLANARKARNLTEDEISAHLKIPAHIVTAIEKNDIDVLPGATYTQGYIRTYAKFLEIPEDVLLQMYSRSVPHNMAAELKPRSSLPGEASSQSPLVKMLTISLIIAGVFIIVYGSFQYYQEKADDMGSERESRDHQFTGTSLDAPTAQRVTIRQDARMSEDGELILTGAETAATMDDAAELTIDIAVEESNSSDSEQKTDEQTSGPEAGQRDEAVQTNIAAEVGQSLVGRDVVEIYADQSTWLEVYDARKQRLFYNMLTEGNSKLLSGKAPFRISLGNAKTTQVSINNNEIDMSAYIRSNNTAIFTVSTDGNKVIFH